MLREATFFATHPYERTDRFLSLPKKNSPFSVQEKLAALKIAEQEEHVLVGSVGWGIQTDLPLATVLQFSRDIDIHESLYHPPFDSVPIVVNDWQQRIRLVHACYEHQEYSLLVAHYLDIALTTCFFLRENPVPTIEYFQAVKILHWTAALIHLYLHSLKEYTNKTNRGNTTWENEARTYIAQTLNILQKQLPVLPYNGNEQISAADLQLTTTALFAELMRYLPTK